MALRSLSKQEFIESMKCIIGRTPIEKLHILFSSFDLDGNGRVSLDELRHVIKSCMSENGLSFTDSDLDLLTQTFFNEADLDGSGELSFDEFVDLLDKSPGILETVVSCDFNIPENGQAPDRNICFGRKLTLSYVKNNLVSYAFFLTFLLINAGLIAGRFYTYRDYIYYARIAKSCGQCLNFTCSFTLFLMLRKSITKLRSWGCSQYLPLDQSIYYHKVIGYFIAFYAIFHGTFHCFYFHDMSKKTNVSVYAYLFTIRENGWPRQISPITGWILLVILLIMVLTSLPVMRRTGNFEVFYYFHQLFIIFYIVLIFHAPKFIYWFAVPGTLYCLEVLIRLVRSFGSRGQTYIAQGTLLPSRVVHLVIKRPHNFNFSPGDFVYIRIPDVAKTEWHPFTISSAPEMSEYLWLHIRAVGEWTNRVYDYFLEQEQLISQRNNSTEDVNGSLVAVDSSGPLSRLKRGKSYPPADGLSAVRREISPIQPDSSDLRIHCSRHSGLLNGNQITLNSVSNNSGSVNQSTNSTNSAKCQRCLHGLPIEESTTPTHDQNGNNVSTQKRPLSKMTSTPYPGSVPHAPFHRTLSTVEPRVRFALDRRLSKIYVCPRPVDCDSARSRKRRMVQLSRKDNTRAEVSPSIIVTDPAKREIKVTIPDENAKLLLRPNSHVSSGESESNSNGQRRANTRVIKLERPLHLHIDGPFGSPSSHIFRTEHAVLIATGIGVTPFASILQSIMFRYMKAKHTCPTCGHWWSDSIPPDTMNLKKVDFVWINRDQKSFEWFVELLSELEITQVMLNESDRFLDIHTYITSAKPKADIKAIGLHIALDKVHEKQNRDLITGLRTRTNAGRPDWNVLFSELSRQRKGRVTVFFCGPPALGRIIQSHCIPYGFAFKKENF